MRLSTWCIIFVFNAFTWSDSEAFGGALFSGDEAVNNLFRLAGFYLGGTIYILSGIHYGYKRHTTDTKPEYEQIVELLDVPEDLYQKYKLKEQLRQQRLQQRQSMGQAGAYPPKKKPYGRQGSAYQKAPLKRQGIFEPRPEVERRTTKQESPTAAPSKGYRFWPFVKRTPCNQLEPGSQKYQRYCAPKPRHLDRNSLIHKNYHPAGA